MQPSQLIQTTAEAPSTQRVCDSGSLRDGGLGVRFEVQAQGQALPAFAVRYDGTVYGYLNQCAHVAMEMDWQAGHFFEPDGQYVMCATHGALYEPHTGLCVGGPCHGAKLSPVTVWEKEGHVYASQRI